jgi:copper homeostasis protein
MILEVPVFDIQSAIIAQQAGAHRIELCSSMPEGGITPSHGMIKWAKENLKIPFYVMIRPRGGNFVYSKAEIEIMLHDIRFCQELGVEGVVFGTLTEKGKVNIPQNIQLLKAADQMQTTFHRAIDRSENPFEALEDIINCGFDRILSSGMKNTAPEGAEMLAQLVAKADSQIIIMPGSGVDDTNIASLHQTVQAKEYHSSAKIWVKTNPQGPSMSEAEDNSGFWTVCPHKIKNILRWMGEGSL